MEENLKELLLKDLCSRLPYGVFLSIDQYDGTTIRRMLTKVECKNGEQCVYVEGNDCGPQSLLDIKPYLRPLSSMVEEEKEYLESLSDMKCILGYAMDKVNFCLKRYLDINGLIPMGLALVAPEGMYNNEE